MEEIIMNLIMFSGEARSLSMEAMQLAKEGKIEEAKELLVKAGEQLGEAHHSQTTLIQNEAAGKKAEVSLLLVHAQDHLMTSITLKDLATELVEVYSRLA
ncbi:PTS lactose/cellobiose transporter subunit IIA [Clostridium massiliamazoniense]|uniref:PTS lactose/cellobiose transporter subunit IIA n=1 Tax=Clostridium massiliamazoniense TaxID=1347366 RepID=UPI0006D76743|nr:PTS lactose/cellobiose transporter subunit IIA [Clostridium massiliamazoniense]